jgi:hypothetical protein
MHCTNCLCNGTSHIVPCAPQVLTVSPCHHACLLSPTDLSEWTRVVLNSAENDTMWSNFTQLTDLRLAGGGPLSAGLAALQPQIKILRLSYAPLGTAEPHWHPHAVLVTSLACAQAGFACCKAWHMLTATYVLHPR